jgi:ketosteroid isomerase-like protein
MLKLRKPVSKNLRTVLAILEDEVRGDVNAALKKLAKGYTNTWVYKGYDGKLFPRTSPDLRGELKDAYVIKGRTYDIKHIAEGKNLVMVELVESYPDPKTKKVYRTPLVLVLEMHAGKVRKGRHYCDPRLSLLFLTKKQVEKAFR